tara:strand:+ start:556 stop:861 length:306 start_codon:yes stop_codon:yes gene_type:complete
VVTALLDAGANPLVEDKDGNSPLHVACLHGIMEVVEVSIQPIAMKIVRDSTDESVEIIIIIIIILIMIIIIIMIMIMIRLSFLLLSVLYANRFIEYELRVT